MEFDGAIRRAATEAVGSAIRILVEVVLKVQPTLRSLTAYDH